MLVVTSQKQLEEAMEAGKCEFKIDGFVAELRKNSHAELRENSRAELRENSHAELWDNSHAVLWDFSVAHIKSKAAKAKGTSSTAIVAVAYPSTVAVWCEMKGIVPKNGRIRLWKTTRKDGTDFYSGKIQYNTKKEIVCPDWQDDYASECGAGLHLADSPSGARYFVGDTEEARLFQVSARIEDCVCFGGHPEYPMKIRARACRMVKEYPIDYKEEW